MNIVGRFLANKAMNAAWRSATRSGVNSDRPADDAESAKTFLAIMTVVALPILGMASCMTGNVGMFWLGLFLFWVAPTAVFVAIFFLPDRWFISRQRGSHLKERAGRRTMRVERPDQCPASGEKCDGTTCRIIEGSIKCYREWLERDSSSEHTSIAGVVEEIRRHTDYSEINSQSTCPVTGDKCKWENAPCSEPDGISSCIERRFNRRLPEVHCPASGYKCIYGLFMCRDSDGSISCLRESRERNSSREQPTAIEADLDAPPATDVTPAIERPYTVYFIQEKEDDGKCKVGITYSLASRLRSLQTGNPNDLEVAHTIHVSSKVVAEQIEEAVLNAVRNAGAEMKGEWFQSAILPWAKQVAEKERQRIDSNVC
ncbi:MAG: GIY-YIG nuclease family protein [Chloroflexi bacterium]|nr:GIY-YIG nuclease family protein [Chloroflexota bacterium]